MALRLRLADGWAAGCMRRVERGAVLVPVGQMHSLQRAGAARSFAGFLAPRALLAGRLSGMGAGRARAGTRGPFTRQGAKNIGGTLIKTYGLPRSRGFRKLFSSWVVGPVPKGQRPGL